VSLFHPLAAAPLSSRPSGTQEEVKSKKEHDRLREACQQFESILLSELWKKMASNARAFGGRNDRDRPFGPLEDLSVEMSSEYLARSGGTGMWKMLYDSLLPHLEAKEKEKGSLS
jgi:Rod binding domain-containing protein